MKKDNYPQFLNVATEKDNLPLRFAHKAMNTIYEILIYHEDEVYAARAANAAFLEIDRLELELSRFNQNSDISRINALKQFETITIGLDCFNCLEQCTGLYQQTKGVFDISAGFVVDLWKKTGPEVKEPDSEMITEALQFTGMPWLHLNKDGFRVQLMSEKISLDLGGYGKGYAIQCVKEMLKEWDIENGLINAGMSSIIPLGRSRWPVEIKHPSSLEQVIKRITLEQKTVSGSGLKKGQHIIDPRSGYPVTDKIAAWAVYENAGISDALSTSFMIMSVDEIEQFCDSNQDIGGLVIDAEGHIISFGEF